MINFSKHILDNGLTVIIHQDQSTPLVATSLIYDVGSKDEDPSRTGFAHLFEHLMFGGSENVDDFDTPIQLAGGENNAFTNNDFTNFYNIAPAKNLETLLWLESDRMKNLKFSQQSLEIQKKVVVEEFKETCLGEPYGDMWHHLSALAYHDHPYKWPTIGIDPTHIETANLDEVKLFFNKHYAPQNAILSIAGPVEISNTVSLVEKWFGEIPPGKKYKRPISNENPKKGKISKHIVTQVPLPSIYLAFHMENRMHKDYYVADMLSDILSNGRSSRLYQKLHKEQHLFGQIDAYITGTFDPGLFIIEGKPNVGISNEVALNAIWNELDDLKENLIDSKELEKMQNKIACSLAYSEVNVMHKAMSLAYFERLGDAGLINHESEKYEQITPDDLQRVARVLFDEDRCIELIYTPSDHESS